MLGIRGSSGYQVSSLDVGRRRDKAFGAMTGFAVVVLRAGVIAHLTKDSSK